MALTIDEVCSRANDETERRVDTTKLTLRLSLFQLIQDLLHENRFWWAKGTATFNTTSGTKDYDLTDASLANRDDIEEIDRVYRVDSENSIEELTPIFDPDEQVFALAATTPAKPARYMIKPDTFATLSLGAPADGTYAIRLLFWRGFNPDLAETPASDIVPVVPGFLHYGLVIGLKAKIYEYLYGQNDNRFVVAAAQWQRFIKNASRKTSFTTERLREWGSGDAVRAV